MKISAEEHSNDIASAVRLPSEISTYPDSANYCPTAGSRWLVIPHRRRYMRSHPGLCQQRKTGEQVRPRKGRRGFDDFAKLPHMPRSHEASMPPANMYLPPQRCTAFSW